MKNREFLCIICRHTFDRKAMPGWSFQAERSLIGPVCDRCFQEAYPYEDPWEDEWCPWLMGHVIVQAF